MTAATRERRPDRASAPAETAFRGALLLAILVYGLATPVVNFGHLPVEVRALIINTRPYAFLVLTGSAVLLLAATGQLHPVSRYRRGRAAAALVFAASTPVVFATILAVKGRSRAVELIVLYGLWFVFVYLVMPSLLRTRRSLDRLMAFTAAASVLGFLAIMVVVRRAPDVLTALFLERATFGFVNPVSFAQIPQLFVVAAGFLLSTGKVRSRLGRLAMWGLMVGAMALIMQTSARNVMAFVGGLAVTYTFLRGRRWMALAVLLLGVVLMIAVRPTQQTSLHDLSSGRSTLWQDTLETSFTHENMFTTVVGGPIELPQVESAGARYDPLNRDSGKRFETYHVDNTYLELFVHAGLLGLFVFAAPYVVFGQRLARATRRQPAAAFALAIFVGLTVQALFAATIPTIGTPVGFLMMVWAAAAPLALLDEDRLASVI